MLECDETILANGRKKYLKRKNWKNKPILGIAFKRKRKDDLDSGCEKLNDLF